MGSSVDRRSPSQFVGAGCWKGRSSLLLLVAGSRDWWLPDKQKQTDSLSFLLPFFFFELFSLMLRASAVLSCSVTLWQWCRTSYLLSAWHQLSFYGQSEQNMLDIFPNVGNILVNNKQHTEHRHWLTYSFALLEYNQCLILTCRLLIKL